MFGFLLFSLISVGLSSQCEISVKNVGQKNFVWHISYAGNFDYEAELGPEDHDNYSCSCVPHDMEIRMPDGFYCYHFMNCIENKDFLVEVTDFAIYINVGSQTEKMCVI